MFLRVAPEIWRLFQEAFRAVSPARALLDDIASGIRRSVPNVPRHRTRRAVAKMRDWRGRLWILHPTKGWRLG